MKNLLTNLDNKILDNFNINHLEKFISDYNREWFLKESGEEHYRLLAYISSKINNIQILDIGTHHGTSAISFSYNLTNEILSYDIENHLITNEFPTNIKFKIGNILENKDDILNSQIILVDAAHDGKFEKEFLLFIKNNNYKGTVFFDDIHWSNEMRDFWNNVCKNEDKLDLTFYGHWSGTGVIFFE